MNILLFFVVPFLLLLGYFAYKGNRHIRSYHREVGCPYINKIVEADDEDLIADEQFRLSVAYQNGSYMLAKNESRALEYCKKAAERGHAVAQLFMVQWLMQFPDDHNKDVMEWLVKAANQGE